MRSEPSVDQAFQLAIACGYSARWIIMAEVGDMFASPTEAGRSNLQRGRLRRGSQLAEESEHDGFGDGYTVEDEKRYEL